MSVNMIKHKLNNSGFGVQFSPFKSNIIAVCCSQNFGIVGNGSISILNKNENIFNEIWKRDTVDCLYDICWSEVWDSILVVGDVKGKIHVYNVNISPQSSPVQILAEHQKEVASVKWNIARENVLLSASWDKTVKLWCIDRPNSIATFIGHKGPIYAVSWNAQNKDIFSSVSGDWNVIIWDKRQLQPSINFQAHSNGVISVDWCKYNEYILATGSVDKKIRIWDIRSKNVPIAQLEGHEYPVRRLLFSPFVENEILSCSYDMTVRLWNYYNGTGNQIRLWDEHSEFVNGIDYSRHEKNVIASVGWDQNLCLMNTYDVY